MDEIGDFCPTRTKWSKLIHAGAVRDLGETSVDTGVLFCGHHHDEIHKAEWVIRFAADGHPESIPPPWIDPDQKPRRGEMHHWRELVDE